MKKTLIAFTDELRTALDHLAEKDGTHLGELIEALLRDAPRVKRAKTALSLTWTERTPRGNFSKVRGTPQK